MRIAQIFTGALLAQISAATSLHADLKGWPPEVREIQFLSESDQSEQPALFYAPETNTPRPLVIFLHQWAGDYLARGGINIARWCVKKDWIFAQPHFRGPNTRPEAMGSDLVISDIQGTVDYAKAHADVDPTKIYLVGASGGGHLALLAAGRMPGIFQAVSAWVPITDLLAWHQQCKGTRHKKYAANIETASGGNLASGSDSEKEAIRRSPLTWLSQASGTEFDLNAGIHDGHSGAVPISHTFQAYNVLAQPEDRISDADIAIMTEEETVPDALRFAGDDPAYEDKPVLFRTESPGVRITIFEGGHQIIPTAALAWLEKIALSSERTSASLDHQRDKLDISSE